MQFLRNSLLLVEFIALVMKAANYAALKRTLQRSGLSSDRLTAPYVRCHTSIVHVNIKSVHQRSRRQTKLVVVAQSLITGAADLGQLFDLGQLSSYIVLRGRRSAVPRHNGRRFDVGK